MQRGRSSSLSDNSGVDRRRGRGVEGIAADFNGSASLGLVFDVLCWKPSHDWATMTGFFDFILEEDSSKRMVHCGPKEYVVVPKSFLYGVAAGIDWRRGG